MYLGEILAALPMVDDPDALRLAEDNPPLRAALEQFRPENWWGTGAGKALLRVARDEGLPLAWVPRNAIISDLAQAQDANGRLTILKSRSREVLADCMQALEMCNDAEIADHVALAKRAVEAFAGGHVEAAMALAVAIGEPLAVWASKPRSKGFASQAEHDEWKERQTDPRMKYKLAKLEQDEVGEDFADPWHFQYQVLLAPVPRFFTSWFPSSGDPAPLHLSRHVVAHQPTTAHFTEANSLLSLMLVTGILREQQSWIEGSPLTSSSGREPVVSGRPSVIERRLNIDSTPLARQLGAPGRGT